MTFNKIVSAVTLKGGSGKSTFITNFATACAADDKSVIIIDTDPDNLTSVNWSSRRDELNLSSKKNIIAINRSGKIITTVNQFSTQYNYVLIDVAGSDNRALRDSLIVSDIVIIPVIPSIPDLDTINKLYELIEELEREDCKYYFLINQANPHYKVDSEVQAKQYLEDFKLVSILNNSLKSREAYKNAMNQGRGAIELKDKKAVDEFFNTYKEIINNE